MSRVILCLVALHLAPALAAAQPTVTWTAQAPDGGAIQGGVSIGAGGPPNQGPPRDRPPARTGTSRIRGRVMLADTGLPARRAIVRVTGSELREPRSTVTDVDGRYDIGDLPSGRFSVSASKNTYVTISYGQTRPMEPGRPIEVGDNQIVEKVDFSLPRGGVITGRIVDEYGEPVANAVVQPMQNRFMGGQQRPMMSGQPFTTSDTGEYRLWGLSPGQYFVSANPRGMGGFMMDNSDDRSGYATTYYPGTASLGEAQPITIAAGQTASGVDIMLAATRTSRVSGIAMDSRGEPIRVGMVMAMQSGVTGMIGPQGGQIRPDGTFVISGLAPGEYMLRATVPPARPGGGAPEMLTANVTVAGADVTGVVLAPLQPAVVRGRIVFDPPTTSLQPSMIQVMATPQTPGPTMMAVTQGGPQMVSEDFTFEIKAAPGRMLLRALVRGPAGVPNAPWVVKSVTHDTADVTDRGLDLESGHGLDGVEIVLTNRSQVVSGQITDGRNAQVTDATVMFFAQDREKWGPTSRYQAVARPDQNGRYTARTLPPGDYYAVALQSVDQTRRGDPGYYDLLIPYAALFTVREAETRVLDLKLAVPR
jgi:protocatechuate 3,4-dioxygenase beta subunit